MARSKKVLKDTTNKKNTSTTKKKKTKKLDENQWRNHILAFYKSDVSQIKFLEADALKRDPFRYRWEGSRLREIKKANATYSYAEKQYDRWFCQWKGGPRRQQLEVYIEEEEEEEDDGISADTTTDVNAQALNEKDNDDDDDDDDDDDETNSDFLSIPLQQVEEEAKKPRISKLEGDKMKELLVEFYLYTDAKKKLLTFIREKNLFSNKNAIFRHWKDGGLEQNKSFNNHVSQAMKEYDDWCVNEKKKRSETNKNNATDKKAIPVELEIFMHELIKQLALCGQGIGKKAARQIIKEALKDGIDTGDGKASFSRSTLNRFIQNYNLECKSVKNIDPARIAQVTPENRDAFFFRLDQIVKLIHSIDPDNCKATVWAKVDAACIYNIDEMGTDPTKHRDVLLIPEEVRTRLFQATPEGDRPSAHVSLAVCSSANGQYKDQRANIQGAPMPMVIHSAREQQDGRTPLQKRLSLYEEQETVQFDNNCTVGFTEGKALGVTVRTSSNGSMTKELFLDLVLHLIKHLPSNQGADGMYSFLLLDNHVSRWNPKALYILFKNRIIPIFFPSHLSIVIQPQDNGVILFLHKCLEEASLLERLFEKDT
jgi:hypothetical protein